MLTEEEAKMKWCQQRSAATAELIGAHCMASECMAWRWGREAIRTLDEWEIENVVYARSDTHGYCGKAGAP